MFVSAAARPGHMRCWQRRRRPEGGGGRRGEMTEGRDRERGVPGRGCRCGSEIPGRTDYLKFDEPGHSNAAEMPALGRGGR